MITTSLRMERINVTQCESAGAKSLIRSYVDTGHDLVSAEDVADAFKY